MIIIWKFHSGMVIFYGSAYVVILLALKTVNEIKLGKYRSKINFSDFFFVCFGCNVFENFQNYKYQSWNISAGFFTQLM
jgi:hypothetical protein